jgi:dTDP-4-dehydrorhamnose 3,5-epimerase
MPFIFNKLEIPDVIQILPTVIPDRRGFFLEYYKYSEFCKYGITEIFAQDNHSKSVKDVLRGLHYQKNPKAQGKLVRCTQGKILDVCVDIRKNSPWYGQWVGKVLSDENMFMLYIPPGFAHGFIVLSDSAEVMYKVTEEYSPENDSGIIWNDPDIAIDWGINTPILSEKDSKLPGLKDADNNFIYQQRKEH